MGILRFLLAAAVVAQHTFGVILISGAQAVEVFFVISGFLMSLILNGSGGYRNARTFWLNRALRIFPVYWLVAVTTLIFNSQTDAGGFFKTFGEAPEQGKLLLGISNLTIFFQDLVMLLDVNNQTLVWKRNFEDFQFPLHWGLLVPQGWTLSLELMFYLLAPFILKNRKRLIFIFLGSLGLRLLVTFLGLPQDPWVYRFFPSELVLFLSGAIAHQFISPHFKKHIAEKMPTKQISILATAALVAILSVNYLNLPGELTTLVLVILAMSGIPVLFEFSSRFQFDRRMGDLSYPIYVWHMVIFWFINMKTNYELTPFELFISTLFVATCLATITNRLLERPVQKIRLKIRTEQRGSKAKP